MNNKENKVAQILQKNVVSQPDCPPEAQQYRVSLILNKPDSSPINVLLPHPPPAILVIKNHNAVFSYVQMELDASDKVVFVFKETPSALFDLSLPEEVE